MRIDSGIKYPSFGKGTIFKRKNMVTFYLLTKENTIWRDLGLCSSSSRL